MLPNPKAPYVRVSRGKIVVQQTVIPIDGAILFQSASAKMVARFLVGMDADAPIWAQSMMNSIKFGWPTPSARVDVLAHIPAEKRLLLDARSTSRPG